MDSIDERHNANRPWPQVERVHYLYLALLVILGAGLRFYRIDVPGFTEGADAMYAKTARTLAVVFYWAWQHMGLLGEPAVVNEQLQLLFARLDHEPIMPYSCKPAYDFINTFLIACIGYEDWVLSVSSAIAGVLSLVGIFLLGSHLYGVRVALIGVALLSVSGSGLVFSRYGQSHMLAVVCFVFGFWLYCQSISGKGSLYRLAVAAAFLTLSLGTHPNMVPYVGMLAMGEIFLLIRRQRTVGELGQRILVALGSLIAVAVLLNLPFVLLKYFASPFLAHAETYMSYPVATYLEQLPHHFGLVFNDKLIPPSLAERAYVYIVVLWAWEGLPLLLLVLLGLVRAARYPTDLSFFDLLLVAQVTIPIMFWILSENLAVYRFSAGALPSLVLVAARVLYGLAEQVSRCTPLNECWAAVILSGVLMAYNVQANLVLFEAQSAHKVAAQWLLQQGEERLAVHHTFSWHFYGIEPIELQDDLESVRYTAFYRLYMTDAERKMLSAFAEVEPVQVFAHKRPGKLLEVNLMRDSMVLKLLGYIPRIGTTVTRVRETVLARNELRRLEIYDLQAGRGRFSTQN